MRVLKIKRKLTVLFYKNLEPYKTRRRYRSLKKFFAFGLVDMQNNLGKAINALNIAKEITSNFKK